MTVLIGLAINNVVRLRNIASADSGDGRVQKHDALLGYEYLITHINRGVFRANRNRRCGNAEQIRLEVENCRTTIHKPIAIRVYFTISQWQQQREDIHDGTGTRWYTDRIPFHIYRSLRDESIARRWVININSLAVVVNRLVGDLAGHVHDDT